MLTGRSTQRLPNHAGFVVRDSEGESMLLNLDLEGFAVSPISASRPASDFAGTEEAREEIHEGLHHKASDYPYWLWLTLC